MKYKLQQRAYIRMTKKVVDDYVGRLPVEDRPKRLSWKEMVKKPGDKLQLLVCLLGSGNESDNLLGENLSQLFYRRSKLTGDCFDNWRTFVSDPGEVIRFLTSRAKGAPESAEEDKIAKGLNMCNRKAADLCICIKQLVIAAYSRANNTRYADVIARLTKEGVYSTENAAAIRRPLPEDIIAGTPSDIFPRQFSYDFFISIHGVGDKVACIFGEAGYGIAYVSVQRFSFIVNMGTYESPMTDQLARLTTCPGPGDRCSCQQVGHMRRHLHTAPECSCQII